MMNLSTEEKAEKKETAEEKQGKHSLKRYLLEKMQGWINGLLEAERDEFLGRGRYAPLSGKDGNYRNGYRPRSINFFGLGQIELKVPRDRKGEFESAWLPERKGQDPEREAFLAEAFLAGVFDARPGTDHGEALGTSVRLEADFSDRRARQPGFGSLADAAVGRTEV